VVGRLPYLGFFDEQSATTAARHLRRQGYDVYQRRAGAYSMLGWLEDPLLPHMLRWREAQLASTLLHELTHATLWIPGSVAFNESFANFVGNEAALRYLIEKHGEASDPVRAELDRREDRIAYRAMLRELYQELDALYRSNRTREAILRDKAAILATLPQRTVLLDLHREAAYLRGLRSGEWNNARLVQYRTYNRSSDWFATLLGQEGGDLRAFMARVEALTERADDPYAALAKAVGADPEHDPSSGGRQR
jgi:predicted aminopeptidase